eukprot:m.119832 g.119832  ORF g.119832 m.119832 type:complete len:67 (+) comp16483_c1_seq1:1410-1610(+)
MSEKERLAFCDVTQAPTLPRQTMIDVVVFLPLFDLSACLPWPVLSRERKGLTPPSLDSFDLSLVCV